MKFVFSLIVISVLSVSSYAQGLVNFNYQITYPLGETQNYIDKVSFRGVGLEWRKYVEEDISVGISLNWNVFNEVESGLIHLDEADVSGTQNRTLNSFPLLIATHYYMGQNRSVRPYAGLGIGTYFIENKFGIGIYSFKESKWHFGIAPEIGVQIPLGFDASAIFSVKYNYAFKSGDAKTQSYVGLYIGIAADIF